MTAVLPKAFHVATFDNKAARGLPCLVERFRLADANTLIVTQQFEDPGAFEGTAARIMSFRRDDDHVYPYDCDATYGLAIDSRQGPGCGGKLGLIPRRGNGMNVGTFWTILASVLVTAAVTGFARHVQAQGGAGEWAQRTPWGDLDLQGEWTSEGEYGVPLERPAEFGTREFLTDEEYAKRLADVQERDERDLQRVDVLAGKVDGPNAPIPHWREYETDSRRTSLVIDPPNGRLPPRTSQAAPPAVQRCGSLQRGEPCDSYVDYGLGVRCIVHGGGFPDAMFPAVYNANFRIVQAPGVVAITYELIHDTRVIPIDSSPQGEHVSPAIRMYMGDARGHWEGATFVVETTNLQGGTRGASSDLRLVERFRRVSKDLIEYQVTFVDPRTWTTSWTAALDLKARPDDAGVFEYACHEGNYGMRNMLSTARYLERQATSPRP